MKLKKTQSRLGNKLIFIFGLFLFGCQEQKDNSLVTYGNDGVVQKILYKNPLGKDSLSIFFKDGHVEYIQSNNQSVGQTIWFHPGGKVEQIFSYRDGNKNGHFYSFYESGALKEHRFLRNNREILYGADYYDDSISVIKQSLHFNNDGNLFYKKKFDSTGRFLREEGGATR
jgi:hypothetical protein